MPVTVEATNTLLAGLRKAHPTPAQLADRYLLTLRDIAEALAEHATITQAQLRWWCDLISAYEEDNEKPKRAWRTTGTLARDIGVPAVEMYAGRIPESAARHAAEILTSERDAIYARYLAIGLDAYRQRGEAISQMLAFAPPDSLPVVCDGIQREYECAATFEQAMRPRCFPPHPASPPRPLTASAR
jgi:hypothetical protein